MMTEDNANRYSKVKRFRHEYKYMINAKQENILQIRAEAVLMRDVHVKEDGTYFIRSLYFDDIKDTCLWENISGLDPRSKFRIRYYNSDTDRIVLEKKTKSRGMCLKEACRITKEECEAFLNGTAPIVTKDMPVEKQKLFTEINLRQLFPKVIVSYERVPFVYSGGNVRVTFDRKITSSAQLDRFLMGDYVQRPILSCGDSILEVKWDEILPAHIKQTLHMDGLQWTAFSKYYMCRKFMM